MYGTWQCLSLLLSGAQVVLSSPLAVSNPLSLSSGSFNLTVPVGYPTVSLSQIRIPTDFKLEPQFTNPNHQPKEAYYYNIIVALASVAIKDFDGVVTEQVYTTDRFPRLPVFFNTPPPSGPIPTRYAVWALTLAPVFLDVVIGFKTVFFSLQWLGEEVGGLALGDSRSISRFLESHSNETDKMTHNLAMSAAPIEAATPGIVALEELVEATNLTAPSNADRLNIEFEYYGQTLLKQSIFLAIISALSDVAVKAHQDKVIGKFSSFFDDEHALFTTEAIEPARTSPPYYTYGTMIGTLALAADYLVQHRDYHELKMKIKVNDIVVANAALSYLDDPHLVASASGEGSSVATA